LENNVLEEPFSLVGQDLGDIGHEDVPESTFQEPFEFLDVDVEYEESLDVLDKAIEVLVWLHFLEIDFLEFEKVRFVAPERQFLALGFLFGLFVESLVRCFRACTELSESLTQ
jgi:hypothetical protein